MTSSFRENVTSLAANPSYSDTRDPTVFNWERRVDHYLTSIKKIPHTGPKETGAIPFDWVECT